MLLVVVLELSVGVVCLRYVLLVVKAFVFPVYCLGRLCWLLIELLVLPSWAFCLGC